MSPHYHIHPNTHEAFIGVWGRHGQVQTTVPRFPVEFEKPPHLLTPCRVQSQIFRTQAINTCWHQLSNGALPKNYLRWGWLSEPFLCAYPSFTLTDTVIQKFPPTAPTFSIIISSDIWLLQEETSWEPAGNLQFLWWCRPAVVFGFSLFW